MTDAKNVEYKTLKRFLRLSEKDKKKAIMDADVLLKGERKHLSNSLDFFRAFVIEAHKIAQHRDHYSARTIAEVLRHNSLIEDGSKHFKISNDIIPLAAHVSMDMFPALNGLFSTKRR